MSPGRKLLLAERHGWLPKDQQSARPSTCTRPADPLVSCPFRSLNDAMEDPAADLTQDQAADFASEAKKACGNAFKGKGLPSFALRDPNARELSLRTRFGKGIPG